MKKFLLALAFLLAPFVAEASTCASYPFTLTNGTTADATQVMANFNSILNCANSNLQPTLSLPLSIANGGTNSATASGALTNLGALAIANNLSDLGSAATARTNLGLGTAAVVNTGTSGATIPLLNGANLWSAGVTQQFNGNIIVENPASIFVDGAAGTNRQILWTTAGSNRWLEEATSTAESGSNVGSDLEVNRYSDAGSFLDAPLVIARSTGIATFADGISVSGAAGLPAGTTAGGNQVVTTNDSRFVGPTQNHQAGNYTFVIGDAGKQIYHANGDGAATWTIPANGSVAYAVVTKIELVNACGGGSITLNITTDTLNFYPSGSAGSRTLAACGIATLTKITSTLWVITGVGLS